MNAALREELPGGGVRPADPACAQEWTQFFPLNREHLKRVSVLVGSKAVHLTVAIAQRLSRTGNLIQIHSDPQTFAAQLAKS